MWFSKSMQSLIFRLGSSSWQLFLELSALFHLLTEALAATLFPKLRKGTQIPGNTLLQLYQLGYNAAPIVCLLSFLIGLTLAVQSVMQLEKFGASSFLASGIGLSMVTEIGPVLTAVILAGRSGSAITAEIASMSVSEEIKALMAMGLKPLPLLLFPRFWAMTIMGPILTLCSVIMGILAGLLISIGMAHLSPSLFWNELASAVTPNFIFQCITKSVTFGWIIALIAVRRGMIARGGASSVGKETTACVVYSICGIIIADAIFSFIFYT